MSFRQLKKTVQGEDREGSFTTVRRYSEFLLIRNWMVIRWPGCVIPPIPPKKVVVRNRSIMNHYPGKFGSKLH
jgi:Phox homology (PX) domain protein